MSFEPVIRSTKTTTVRVAPSTTTETQTETEKEPELEQEQIKPISVGSLQSGSGSIISILVQKNAELERKVNGLMDYLENWIDVGDLNMSDIKQYIENYSQ